MIVLQLGGAAALARAMAADSGDRPDLAWLLHGPSDPLVVAAEPDEAAPLMAAE